jgi:BTB/POZ domain
MASTSGEHSAKRKRVKEPDSSLPTRDKPYFDDGNIILAVKNSHFRVYRGVLATLSPVFSDMFALPQPPKGEILVDGCPVIELDDSAEDWRTLLSAVFPRYYHITLSMSDLSP